MELPDQQIQPYSNKKLLIIEDDYFIVDIYTSILESAGFEVSSVLDGRHAFEQARIDKPAVILLDIMLPLVNGLEVLKQLKADPLTKKIPVVLITNLGHQDVIKEAFALGAQGFLLKVRSSAEDLLRIVNTFIKNPEYQMDASFAE